VKKEYSDIQLFDPQPGDEFCLRIDKREKRFRAMAHPKALGFVHAIEGAKATVYRIKALHADGHDYALKVMKLRYRNFELEQICSNLAELRTIPGLKVCERQCLSPAYSPNTLEQYRNLQYAILMPWIQGSSWINILALGREGQNLFNRHETLCLASNLAAVLSTLETLGVAHCDLSASNVMVDPDPEKLRIELIDVEDLFIPSFQQPKHRPLGTPGYQHRACSQGHWDARSDRFAGAILLAEMLGWYDERVRAISYGESYFKPAELQLDECRRFDVLVDAIITHDSSLAGMFRRAWNSTTLNECPSLKEWNRTLNRVKMINK
jgi:tRNA A-37 threonylcarbamoyl transferase component Bud32